MYTVETAPYGYRITIGGKVEESEARDALARSRAALTDRRGPFGVLVDIRTLRPLDPATQAVVNESQLLFLHGGLERSVVVLASAVMTLQFRRIAQETGVKKHERYIDGSKDADWEQTALSWIVDGLEPMDKAA